MASLGDLERSIMDQLWSSADPMTATTLRDRLAESPDSAEGRELAVTTVLTVLSRLEKKGLVARSRTSRPHQYRAISTREAHTVSLMNEVLGQAPDRDAVLSRFVGSMSEEDASLLRQILRGRD
ncbi:BlaI/MecI/CopY family transcriptional regulator [Tersicoccus sp. Bi-70]|uniref:BlaI/MecI/CopY family transcriptional regulator n=1 Tax=Tersicoccus sp. Bi-70 TaxID=1897634 RepID=UPI0009778D86|nr:BlaI/MecI/CopY family transcriptional regulator [Tersicoccus sp. Bi-70]OMH33171.1 transcriptional regulator [Tersicoccus sp. Bi-70]